MAAIRADLPDVGSTHVRLEQIGPGVFAAIARPGGVAHSNAGIVDLGDRTLIFDALGTPKAAEELRAAAERLTGRPASYVVNSHADHDHWLGNQAFASDVTIVSTSKTRERMVTQGAAYIRRCRENPAILEDQIRAAEKRLRSETDERWRVSLAGRAANLRNELEAMRTLTPRFPDQTFENKVVFHGTRRTVELLTWGGGHSSSDAFVLLLAERIVFMGDLGFFQFHLPLMSGDRRVLASILERLIGLDLETFVPGHGPLGTQADVQLQIAYIAALEELAARAVAEGGSTDDAARQPVPPPFSAWSHGMGLYEANMRFLHRSLSERRNSSECQTKKRE
jgi:glyoxylase-like metal-dependent hydrolase (beta-lactamase superfamily II)